MDAKVRVMQSHDFSHFEITLSETDQTLEQVDELRKAAARLSDKGIRQYKTKMEHLNRIEKLSYDHERLRKQVAEFKDTKPKSYWTPEQKAMAKRLGTLDYWANREYDYEDDWDEEWEF